MVKNICIISFIGMLLSSCSMNFVAKTATQKYEGTITIIPVEECKK